MRHASLAVLALAFATGACSKEPAGALPLPVIPQTSALDATKGVLGALQAGNPAGFWAAMPESWQDDVNRLVREVGYKMDPGGYDEIAALVRRFVTVLRQQRQYFLGSSMFRAQEGVQAAAIQRNWDCMMDFMDALLESQLGSAEGMRSFDGSLFLRTDGARLMSSMRSVADSQGSDLMAHLAEVRIEALDSKGDAQVLRFSAAGEQPQELRFVMVGGRWVPEPLALQWDEEMEQALRAVDGMPDMSEPQARMQLEIVTSMLGAIVERLEQVDSQEEFDEACRGMAGMMNRPPR